MKISTETTFLMRKTHHHHCAFWWVFFIKNEQSTETSCLVNNSTINASNLQILTYVLRRRGGGEYYSSAWLDNDLEQSVLTIAVRGSIYTLKNFWEPQKFDLFKWYFVDYDSHFSRALEMNYYLTSSWKYLWKIIILRLKQRFL